MCGFCGFFQKSSGLFVQPVPQSFIQLLGPHFAPVHGCVIIFRQQVHGLLPERFPLVEPKGVCQYAVHGSVLPVHGAPHSLRLSPQVLQVVAAQDGQDLLPGVPVGDLRQHGQGHIHIQGGADPVALTGKQRPCGRGEIGFQPVGEALLRPQGVEVLPPAVIDRLKSLVVKFTVPFDIFLLVGIGCHLGIFRSGQHLHAAPAQIYARPEENAQQDHRRQNCRHCRRPAGDFPLFRLFHILVRQIRYCIEHVFLFHGTSTPFASR